jgi:parallel beta-helix repeat protein
MREKSAALFLLFVLCFILVSNPNVEVVEATFPTPPSYPSPAIFIKSDGSIDPSSAPIHRDGDIYTLTDHIVGYSIIVEKDNIILDGGGYTLRGYGSEDNFSLEGFTDPTGILIMQHNGVTVRNMKISGFSYGIKITKLYTIVCSNNVLENNTVTDNYYGVYLSGSWFTVLRNNNMSNNVCNFYLYDFVEMLNPDSDLFINDIDSTNTVDGKPIIYWVNEHNKIVPSDAGYVALVKCTNMIVQNLNLSDNGQGILLVYSTNSLITQNHMSNTEWGIFAYNSSNLLITKNNLENNNVGIRVVRNSNRNTISENLIADNSNGIDISYDSVYISIFGNMIADNDGWGLLVYSHNNLIYNNSFLHNNIEGGLQVRILTDEGMPSGNMWDNGIIGNYWSDYTTRYPNATEIADSGIGDTPFQLSANNTDRYPIMETAVIPEFPSWTLLPLLITATLTAVFYKKRLTKSRQSSVHIRLLIEVHC